MATLKPSESRRLYSWWWDSHIIPTNSKWLQENLKDMDATVKAMIKLVEEDADTFKRKIELYYRKRPEFMKLIEEFYRAYRALAERYDHVTRVLDEAERTMAEAFPDHVPFVLPDDSPAGSSTTEAEPHTLEIPLYEPDDVQEKILPNDVFHLSAETQITSESERASKAEMEVQKLKEALAKLESEKAGLLHYQQSLEKISHLETEVSSAQASTTGLHERASKAETEVQTLKEMLSNLEAEREAGLLQYHQCLEMISSLEAKITNAEESAKNLDERACKAETEAENLKEALSRLENEKDAALLKYKECLETISNLEIKIASAEEEAKNLNERAERAETEVQTLKQALVKLEEQKEAAALQYQQCLERISIPESEVSAQEARRLNTVIETGVAKLPSSEEHCLLLESINQSLRSELEALVPKMGMQTQELREKHEELQSFHTRIQEDRLHFLQADAALRAVQSLHFQSQEGQRNLEVELQRTVQVLKDVEFQKQGLEDKVQQIKEDIKILEDQNLSSARSMKSLHDEMFDLKETKGRLEAEVELRLDQRNALQQEIYCLKEEINDLNRRLLSIIEQVESLGLNPESLSSAVKNLQDENSKLKEICQRGRDEKVTLLEKLDNMEKVLEKNALLENSLSDVTAELERLREKVKLLDGSCQSLCEEKSALVAEKANLVSELEIIAEKVEKLLEKSSLLENPLSGAISELEGSKTKAKGLEESCEFLENENSALLSEKLSLVSQLQIVQQRLDELENKFTQLEEKYFGLEEKKETTVSQVKELRVSLDLEKQERASFAKSNENRLATLEKHIHVLQEEGQWRKKEIEEELDRSMNTQVEIFILQSFIRDMEEKNFSLFIECKKHFEASNLSEKLISELEQKNHKLNVETKLLSDQIEKLRTGIIEILSSLEVETDYGSHDKIREDQMLLKSILRKIEDKNCSFLKARDEKQQLSFQNFVLITLLEQMKLQTALLERERNTLEKEFKPQMEELLMLQNEKHKLLEMNVQLETQIKMGEHREEILKSEMEKLQAKFSEMQESYLVSQNENSKLFEEKGVLRKELSDMKEVAHMLDEESVLSKAFALENLLILEGCITEKSVKLEGFSKDLDCLCGVNSDLQNVIRIILEKLEIVEGEKLHPKKSAEELENEMSGVRNANEQLNHHIITGKDLLYQKEMELPDAEQKHRVAESENKMLCRDVEDLKKELNESEVLKQELEKDNLELLADKSRLIMEIGCIHEENRKFESESASKTEEIEQLNGTLHILEGKNEGLKSELAAYLPGIVSLRDSISFLEDHALLQTKMELLLQEVEKAIMQLSDVNSKLTNSAEEKEESRKARRVFEKIERLQVRMQKIQSKLLKPIEYRSKGQTEVQERKHEIKTESSTNWRRSGGDQHRNRDQNQDRERSGYSTMGSKGGMKLSGMQKQVLSLYRGFLRAARTKASEERLRIESTVSAEFRRNARDVDRKNFIYIEYLLRRGSKQLDQLKSPETVGLSSLKIAPNSQSDNNT
ncbi:hypothetical protein NE237_015219 [Protea cynaroides]|uniref:NAB domain-containing protein n=1 Tax=Protea cynaroides TaxID=273540 RepID=A0A9Q0QQV4_9MAGN|nr:hypothetical protein NE237_015219 [Protea cynaroides]